MRAGKKTEAEIGKTRPCIVYVKNLKESEATDIINNSSSTTSGKQTKALRISTRRTIKEKDLDQLVIETPRATRTSKRATTVTNIELSSIKPKSSVSPPRTRNTKADEPSTVPRAAAKTAKQQIKAVATPVTKRRNTALILPVARPCTPLRKRRDTLIQTQIQSEPQPEEIVSEPKAKMYKSKMASTAVATPPPTIAASRSRRSIKPNPKYASDDMVTPKYVSALASENTGKRSVKHLFTDDDDDEDEDLRDLIEEDNDDELNDAAFNPQLHKSDDDDDISERDFQQQLRREKVPPKRGRGRPPKSASAAAAASNNSLQSQAGRGGATHLQQLRRTMAPNLARSQVKVMASPTPGNKRKLEDHNDGPIARKRMTSDWPIINGSTSASKTSGLTVSKSKVVVSNSSGNNNNSSSGASNASGSLRMLQSANAKARPTSTYKVATSTGGGVRNAGSPQVVRTGTVSRQSGSSNALKVQKASAASAANAAAMKAAEADDVPTFTIVNIDDIINQDDVLITRSSSNGGGSKKLLSGARSNNNSRTNQSTSSPITAMSSSRNSGGTPAANAANKRLKTTTSGVGTGTGTGATAKHPLTVNHNKQTSLVVSVGQAKPRPRILNAEMGKKTQPMMKPLMSMGKELCPLTDGDNTEDEDMANDLADDDISISPTSAAAASNQARLMRRVQTNTTKWSTNRRQVLSATASSNASNNQRHQQQQQDRKLTKLLGEGSDDDVFKKPASPSTSTTAVRRYKEHATDEDTAVTAAEPEPEAKQPKYFPPETTTYCEEDGRIVKKITCYETWHVISAPKETSNKTRQQRTCLEMPLVKLANMATSIKVPSTRWTSKVTLYKLSPSLQRQTMTVFKGDLKSYNIPEEERHKYQPSCVLFRRSVLDRSKCRVPFDRAIIFKNKCFYANIDGKHVNLLGAPEVVSSFKEVEILIDVVDSLSLSSDLVEMVTSK
ncbi:hypothetical protein AWZ03_014065 [Drosophila navojoa]|uniref:Uncharacterized protein n=1 Tax=Drosophila navojoa TaxID=7232 RepID=A0A484AS63_DRONA|nr:uncharacterized protein LOC115565109 [Drosophila navojoa]TDG39517.1 hypothetical protein AWZ03_014065 [Drosophila navojoa]